MGRLKTAKAVKTLSFTSFCKDVLGLELTRGQLVLAKVCFDGTDPVDLPEDERAIAAEIFAGTVKRIPHAARSTLVLRCGRRGGKTLLSAAFSLYRMCTADLSKVGRGDKAAAIVVAPDTGAAGQALDQALGLAENAPSLAPLITGRTTKSFTITRPDGRVVRFVVRAKKRGGTTFRGFSLLSVIIDESEFVPSDPTKAVVDSDLISAAKPALLGPLILCSTPWPAESETSRLFDANHGAPKHALAAKATTLRMRDNDPQWVEKVAAEKARDPRNASREYDVELTDADGNWFEGETIDKAISFTYYPSRKYATAAIDLAFVSDSSAIVIVETHAGRADDGRPIVQYAVTFSKMLTPIPGKPLVPSVVVKEFASYAKDYGSGCLVSDAHSIESTRETCRTQGLYVLAGPNGASGKDEMFVHARTLFREGRVILNGDLRLKSQLKSVMEKNLPGGRSMPVLPRSRGNHCDLVSALVLALWMHRRARPVYRDLGNYVA